MVGKYESGGRQGGHRLEDQARTVSNLRRSVGRLSNNYVDRYPREATETTYQPLPDGTRVLVVETGEVLTVRALVREKAATLRNEHQKIPSERHTQRTVLLRTRSYEELVAELALGADGNVARVWKIPRAQEQEYRTILETLWRKFWRWPGARYPRERKTRRTTEDLMTVFAKRYPPRKRKTGRTILAMTPWRETRWQNLGRWRRAKCCGKRELACQGRGTDSNELSRRQIPKRTRCTTYHAMAEFACEVLTVDKGEMVGQKSKEVALAWSFYEGRPPKRRKFWNNVRRELIEVFLDQTVPASTEATRQEGRGRGSGELIFTAMLDNETENENAEDAPAVEDQDDGKDKNANVKNANVEDEPARQESDIEASFFFLNKWRTGETDLIARPTRTITPQMTLSAKNNMITRQVLFGGNNPVDTVNDEDITPGEKNADAQASFVDPDGGMPDVCDLRDDSFNLSGRRWPPFKPLFQDYSMLDYVEEDEEDTREQDDHIDSGDPPTPPQPCWWRELATVVAAVAASGVGGSDSDDDYAAGVDARRKQKEWNMKHGMKVSSSSDEDEDEEEFDADHGSANAGGRKKAKGMASTASKSKSAPPKSTKAKGKAPARADEGEDTDEDEADKAGSRRQPKVTASKAKSKQAPPKSKKGRGKAPAKGDSLDEDQDDQANDADEEDDDDDSDMGYRAGPIPTAVKEQLYQLYEDFSEKLPWLLEWHQNLEANAVAYLREKGRLKRKLQNEVKPVTRLAEQLANSYNVHLWGFVIDPDGDGSFVFGASEGFKEMRKEQMVNLNQQIKDQEHMMGSIAMRKRGLHGHAKSIQNLGRHQNEKLRDTYRRQLATILGGQLWHMCDQAGTLVGLETDKSKFSMKWSVKFVDVAREAKCRLIHYPNALRDANHIIGTHNFHVKSIKAATFAQFMPALVAANSVGGASNEDVMEIVAWDEDELSLPLEEQGEVPVVVDEEGKALVRVKSSEVWVKQVKKDAEKAAKTSKPKAKKKKTAARVVRETAQDDSDSDDRHRGSSPVRYGPPPSPGNENPAAAAFHSADPSHYLLDRSQPHQKFEYQGFSDRPRYFEMAQQGDHHGHYPRQTPSHDGYRAPPPSRPQDDGHGTRSHNPYSYYPAPGPSYREYGYGHPAPSMGSQHYDDRGRRYAPQAPSEQYYEYAPPASRQDGAPAKDYRQRAAGAASQYQPPATVVVPLKSPVRPGPTTPATAAGTGPRLDFAALTEDRRKQALASRTGGTKRRVEEGAEPSDRAVKRAREALVPREETEQDDGPIKLRTRYADRSTHETKNMRVFYATALEEVDPAKPRHKAHQLTYMWNTETGTWKRLAENLVPVFKDETDRERFHKNAEDLGMFSIVG
ncbi:hypothetical protein B0H12DRAFT_1076255 [Mycena haematopus]|nr:hypothetical protein B0H12DRAFT_1076255 [Mycena haematopus]